MNKKNIAIVGIIALVVICGFGSVVFGVSNNVKEAINNYYGETVVQQDFTNTDVDSSDEKMGISDQSGGFVITKKITNSDIATSTNTFTGVDLTNTVSGALIVKEIIISTDSTGLSTTTPGSPLCTGIAVTVEGNSASTTVMTVTTLTNLQANETIDFDNANTAIATRLEDGSNLQVIPVGDHPCMGSGVTTFTMFFDRVDERSHIYE